MSPSHWEHLCPRAPCAQIIVGRRHMLRKLSKLIWVFMEHPKKPQRSLDASVNANAMERLKHCGDGAW